MIQTITPIYDEIEDRIRLTINYQETQNRIDLMINIGVRPHLGKFS